MGWGLTPTLPHLTFEDCLDLLIVFSTMGVYIFLTYERLIIHFPLRSIENAHPAFLYWNCCVIPLIIRSGAEVTPMKVWSVIELHLTISLIVCYRKITAIMFVSPITELYGFLGSDNNVCECAIPARLINYVVRIFHRHSR